MVQPAHLDLHVGLSTKYPLNLHFWLPASKRKFETAPELCVSIREAEQFPLFVYDFLEVIIIIIIIIIIIMDRHCGLVVRVSGYRYRGLGFDSRRYQIF